MNQGFDADKPTLLFAYECENSLAKIIVSNKTINLVLLRFKQGMFFSRTHLDATSHIPCFVFDRDWPIEIQTERFNDFCVRNRIAISHFYNDSEYNQERVQRFASSLGLQGALNEVQARCVRDKAAMKDKLCELGYRTTHYLELTSINDALDFADLHGGFPIIVKWRRGFSSREVYKISSRKQLEELHLNYFSQRFIAESFCPYLIWCFDSLVQSGKVVGTFVTWLPYTNLSFAEKKGRFAQITVSECPRTFNFDGTKITQDLVRGFGLKDGYIHIEIFVSPDGQPIICEFAWRTAGDHMLSNHSIAFGVDVCSSLSDIIVGRKIQPIPSNGRQCVGDMFLPLTDGIVRRITPYEDLRSLDGVLDGGVNYKIGDHIRSKRQYTDCAGWVQIIGQTAEEVLARMHRVYERFEIVTTRQ